MLSIRFEILSGFRTGETVTVAKTYATIGRHANADVRFATDDLAVSSRHAAVVRRGELFLLRDLGSTSGTYVNGQRLRVDHVLAEHDVVQLGAQGPAIEVSLIHDDGIPEPADPILVAMTPQPRRRAVEQPSARDGTGRPPNILQRMLDRIRGVAGLRRWLP